MKSFNSSRSVIKEKYIVANIQFIVSERHASGGVPTFDFFHELDQFIAMFTNFSGEIFRNVNVGAFQKSGFSQNFFFVTVVDKANLNGFVASEVGSVIEAVHAVHLNIA